MAEPARAGTWFAALVVLAVAAIAVTIYWAKLRAERQAAAAVAPAVAVAAPGAEGSPGPQRVYFRFTGAGANYGKLAWSDYGVAAPATSVVEQLSCESLYVAAGRGVCLAASRGVVTTYSAKVFETGSYDVTATIPLAGVPSRTRVSADGALAAATVFVTGHGYDSVDFSTQTLLIDVPRGEVVADLETFAVRERGAQISSADFNFWGVTFTPDRAHFYATLSTAGRHLLVKGDIAARTAEVVRDNVECPSLSPDGTRVAYKHRLVENGRIFWQLQVLDLATGATTSLAERRSVDDQLEWLDNEHVLYSVPSASGAAAATDVWVTPADGKGTPELFLPYAYSPAVVR